MSRTGPGSGLPPGSLSRTWQYALVGGAVSMPLTLAVYWSSGASDHFSFNAVVVGGLIAGFLARRYAADAGAAGLRAGVIGGLAGYVWIAPAIRTSAESFADAWSFAPATGLLFVVFSAVVLGTAAIAGLLGGVVGSWICGKVGRESPSTASA
ncbi:DUF5518 domain-containing protein [Halosimplex rubrum]|uniref:DUF5518 domain-containing protein n=1 Tax=Halosimplex rubrum TaxID=869889 RepID=A0A7D5P2X1_9EURY|nr:DUF5518 domain-containing protein [Halosimplex rubrum]QLH79626.1 DUF5518 domain-containing protein [Halosimplex rubrum]